MALCLPLPNFPVSAAEKAKPGPGADAHTPSQSIRIGEHSSQEILKLMGAKLEEGISQDTLRDYSRAFDRVDTNHDGIHSKTEYIDKGFYMTPQARQGIFNAADADNDGVVTKREYLINRIITDEAKAIVLKMDLNTDGKVQKTEFMANSPIDNASISSVVFDELDIDDDGSLLTPEFLRVWGRWARAGKSDWRFVTPD
jgi:Ca2+-binding EF-hand superfamily protein